MFQHQLSLVPSHWSSEVLMILCPQTDKRSVYMRCFHACGAANFEGWLHFRPLQGEFFPVCWVWVSRYILSLLSCQNNEHNVYIIYIYIFIVRIQAFGHVSKHVRKHVRSEHMPPYMSKEMPYSNWSVCHNGTWTTELQKDFWIYFGIVCHNYVIIHTAYSLP